MKLKKSLPLSFIFLFVLVFTTQTVFAKSYRIRSSDNISRIVDKFYANRSLSKQQIMVGLLTRNPRAFKGGNVNFLLRGRRIQLPKETEMSVVSDADAKAVLSQHNSFFRRGLTGAGKLPKLGSGSKATSATLTKAEKLEQQPTPQESQSEQIEKIKRLEAESKALKQQLDRLLEARKERDKKLLELERSINQSLEEEKKKDSDSSLEALTKELKERNSFLQQKLRETRSQLAENSLSTISLKRRFNDLKNPVAEPIITESENNSSNIISANTASNNVIIAKESAPKFTFNVDEWKKKALDLQTSLGGVFWIIPAILLLLAGFILKRLFGGKRKNQDDGVDYAAQISDAEAIDYLQNNQDETRTNYEEESLEASIKLDVARAYIEAEEMESASNILEEVLAEGTDELKREAEKIMASLKIA